ncbi:MAG: type II toxin-antitoxin system YafQ family toxin [Isosphaeraceae bacterium]|nr:type II toxin-antitoxin system YafQ family toxin [Isosphaeraceae bacterium]
MGLLREVLSTLLARRPLEARHRDHTLCGDWRGWRECHVQTDWLLIYRRR